MSIKPIRQSVSFKSSVPYKLCKNPLLNQTIFLFYLIKKGQVEASIFEKQHWRERTYPVVYKQALMEAKNVAMSLKIPRFRLEMLVKIAKVEQQGKEELVGKVGLLEDSCDKAILLGELGAFKKGVEVASRLEKNELRAFALQKLAIASLQARELDVGLEAINKIPYPKMRTHLFLNRKYPKAKPLSDIRKLEMLFSVITSTSLAHILG